VVRRGRDQDRARGEGDITRGQLRDIPGVDSLYFTMLNHNKRSITVDAKNPKGKAVIER
jgi:formyl-CoA transferase